MHLSQRSLYTCTSHFKALNVFQLNILNILCFTCKCKQNLNSPVFRNIFAHRTKTKYVLRNENFIQEPLCRTNTSQHCISYGGHYFWIKIVISKNFRNKYSFQAFKCELKWYLLLAELNDLEILKHFSQWKQFTYKMIALY